MMDPDLGLDLDLDLDLDPEFNVTRIGTAFSATGSRGLGEPNANKQSGHAQGAQANTLLSQPTVKVDDILCLLESEREARRLR